MRDHPHLAPVRSRQDEVQHLARLVERRSARRREGVLVVEGPHALEEAIAAGATVETVFVASGAPRADEHRRLVARAAAGGAVVIELTPRELGRVADAVTPQPLLAVVASPEVALAEAVASIAAHGIGLVGAGVRDPGNIGTMIRSAEAAGVGAVVFCDGCADVTSPKVVRSSAGSLFHVPVSADAGPAAEVLAALRAAGTWVVGTSADRPGALPLDDLPLDVPTAFVLSNEARGLDDEPGAEALVDTWVTIPMAGRTESLNVAMAATVLVFEAARRRRAGSPAVTHPATPVASARIGARAPRRPPRPRS